jgi:hypothetical protein
MRGFWDEWRRDLRSPVPYVVWLVLTVLVGLAGPFGTYDAMDLPARLELSAVVLALGILYGTAVRALVHGALGLRSLRRGSPLIATLLAITIAPLAGPIFSALPLPVVVEPPPPLDIAVFVFLTSLGVGAYRAATGSLPGEARARPETVGEREPGAPEADPAPRIWQRLPEEKRAPLVAMSVRDHYVDVVTEAGRASLLMRLSDAIREAETVEGARVHRSHWVAWRAVEGVELSATRMSLVLRGGTRVPVSRSYRAEVEARGIGIARAEVPQSTARASTDISAVSAGSSERSPPV